jgi:hypothetical protein
VGEWRYSFSFLELGTIRRQVVSFKPQPLYLQGKNPQHPLNRRLAGSQSRSERCGEEKNFALAGFEPV